MHLSFIDLDLEEFILNGKDELPLLINHLKTEEHIRSSSFDTVVVPKEKNVVPLLLNVPTLRFVNCDVDIR